MGTSMGAMPSNLMTARFKDERAVEIAKKNGELAFALVQKIAKAQNFQEILTIQTRFDQEQMQAYATQMQERGSSTEAATRLIFKKAASS